MEEDMESFKIPNGILVEVDDEFEVVEECSALFPSGQEAGRVMEVLGFEKLPSGTFLRVAWKNDRDHYQQYGREFSPTSLMEALDKDLLKQAT